MGRIGSWRKKKKEQSFRPNHTPHTQNMPTPIPLLVQTQPIPVMTTHSINDASSIGAIGLMMMALFWLYHIRKPPRKRVDGWNDKEL